MEPNPPVDLENSDRFMSKLARHEAVTKDDHTVVFDESIIKSVINNLDGVTKRDGHAAHPPINLMRSRTVANYKPPVMVGSCYNWD